MIRRNFLQAAGSLLAVSALGPKVLAAAAKGAAQNAGDSSTSLNLPFENGARELVAFPQKRPLILLTSRPPQLETPFHIFNEGLITPNDAFFVRYHWSGIPSSIDPTTYRLKIGGMVNQALDLSLEELKKLGEPVDLVAVNQCSGNSRGLSTPRVNGGQLANGAMGNAKWTGIPLKKVLEKAGLKAGAVQVTFNGIDTPPVPTGPDFVKALNVDHAMDGEVMIAWSMNGEDLPLLNGYPLRLIVPGYYGTYWIKHLNDIQVIDKVYDGFWMASAYRIPDNGSGFLAPGTAPAKTIPINRFDVRSFITSHGDGSKLRVGHENLIRGIAFDGGYGVTEVALSVDGGKNWQETKLGKDLGRYSFREWTVAVKPKTKGSMDLRVRAVNRVGQSQPLNGLWNPAGYMRNVVETTRVSAT